MIRNLKALGLAVLAVVALSAVAAASASAKFDSEVEKTTLSGGQTTTHEFTVPAGTTTCEVASFTGSETGTKTASGSFTTETLTITPSYSKCKTVLFGETHETHVIMNGCDYKFHAGATIEGETKVAGTVDIVCPEKKSIEVEITGANICRVTVPSQNGVAGITYHNTGVGASRDVDVTANVSTLRVIQDGAFCPGNNFASSKEFTTGVYKGTTTEIGKNSEGKQVGIWVT
jgi:hypothetical protein